MRKGAYYGDMGLKSKMVSYALLAAVVMGLILFVPAGSLAYWPGWLYLVTMFIPMFIMAQYLLKHDPQLLRRRLQFKEKIGQQQIIIRLIQGFMLVTFLVPGLDYRFGWSRVPPVWVIISTTVIFGGYMIVFWVFKTNSYTSRIIEVEAGQKVVTTGPYGFIRHPMYLGILLVCVFTPIALGSYWMILGFLPLLPLLIWRIVNEEQVLCRDLIGYRAYCAQVKYRLIPGVW